MFATVLLIIGVVVIAFVPVIIRYVDRGDSEKVAVYVGPTDLPGDPVATLTMQLNPPPVTGQAAAGNPPDFDVSRVDSIETGRTEVTAGTYTALLAIERAAAGDLEFTLFTDANSTGRTASLLRQSANSIVAGGPAGPPRHCAAGTGHAVRPGDLHGRLAGSGAGPSRSRTRWRWSAGTCWPSG